MQSLRVVQSVLFCVIDGRDGGVGAGGELNRIADARLIRRGESTVEVHKVTVCKRERWAAGGLDAHEVVDNASELVREHEYVGEGARASANAVTDCQLIHALLGPCLKLNYGRRREACGVVWEGRRSWCVCPRRASVRQDKLGNPRRLVRRRVRGILWVFMARATFIYLFSDRGRTVVIGRRRYGKMDVLWIGLLIENDCDRSLSRGLLFRSHGGIET